MALLCSLAAGWNCACLAADQAAASTTPSAVQVQVFLTQQHLSIAMEYAAGGDMFEYVVRKGGLRESEARWFFQQLIVAVDYIHRMVRNGHAVFCVLSMGLFFPASAPVEVAALTARVAFVVARCRAWLIATSSWRTRCWMAARGH
jgi:hypothetical protein